ncbi:RNA polymerase sigma factor SigA [Thermoflexales bacterium]|nr:RNA polymerase sigma factor SigA [Thermoflexales bacterium]
MMVRRFGVDGQAPQTLDALIAPLGVTTRERVRQIESQALRKVQLSTQRRALRAKLDQLAQWEE